MPGGLGPRFALEAGFLIALAAVAAYARLSTTEIIAVMAGGWLLTAIFEVIAARRERVYLRRGWQPRVEEEAVAVVEPEPKRRRWLRRAPKPEAEVEVLSETEGEVEARAKSEAAAEARPEPEALAHVAPATDDAAPPAPPEHESPPSAPAATDDAAPPAPPEDEAPPSATAATDDAAPPGGTEDEAPPSAPAATDEDTGEFELPPPEPRRWFRRRRAEPPALTEADLEPARPSARHVRLIREGEADATARETAPPDGDDDERKGADTAS
jgi:hypothetical protein